MNVSGVALQNIRQHTSLVLPFPTLTTVLVGPNASGKTTIIEALFLLSTGSSFRAGRIEEMITFGAELGRVKGKVMDEGESDELEVVITRGSVQGKRTQHRLFSVNGVRKRRKDAMGKCLAVLFRPEDMRLVEGSPTRRRTFLNTPLEMLEYSYAVALKAYDDTLKRRNKLLWHIREGDQPRTVLHYWNASLLKHGELLQNRRKVFLESFAKVPFALPFSVEYVPSVISLQRMQQYAEREIAAGHTLIGPHKDDIRILLDQAGSPFDVALYGSRGQQRLAVLWLKFCELAYIRQVTQKNPLLLLDDSMSELDETSQKIVLEMLQKYQAVVTSTDEHVYERIVSFLSPTQVTLHRF